MKKSFSIALFLIAILFQETVFAQDLNFEHFSVDDGMLSSQLHDITQDQYGKLWFSGDQGLSCFDGYGFKNYTTKDGVSDYPVFKFYPQANGDIWCTTFNKSVFSFRGERPVFTAYPYNNTLQAFLDAYITNSLFISKDGSLLMSFTNASGFINISGKGNLLQNTVTKSKQVQVKLCYDFEGNYFFYRTDKTQTLSVRGTWKDCAVADGHASTHGLVRAFFDPLTQVSFFADTKEIQIKHREYVIKIPVNAEPISIGKLSDSLFWVGFRYAGVSIYTMSGKKVRTHLPGKSVTKLFIDHEDGLWISTLNDGVFHSANPAVTSYKNPDTESWVNSLAKDSSGNLWIGYYNGDVSVMSAGVITSRFKSRLRLPAFIRRKNHSGEIYFISDACVFNLNAKKSFLGLTSFNPLNTIFKNKDTILFADHSTLQLTTPVKNSTFRVNFRINKICLHRGDFYLASNKGLYGFKNGEIKKIDRKILTSAKEISDIESWGSSLIVATKGEGIIILNENFVRKISTMDGLSNNVITRVYPQNDSVFWACSNSGLNRILFQKNKKTVITGHSINNGLISNEVSDIAIIQDTIWVGTREGLCSLPLKLLDKDPVNRSHFLTIRYVKMNDKYMPITLRQFKYDENRIEFGFKAISYANKSIVYRYKLAGHENKWNYTKQLSSIYTSLPPGSYTFNLQVKGSNTSWDEDLQTFSFIISPPFWKSWWFSTSAILFGMLLIYAFFRFRILSYNRDIMRELLRQLLKRMTKKTNYLVFRENGKDIRIPTNTICFVKADGNYIEIHTPEKKHVIRHKISSFFDLVPDPLEYLRISRSCIIRLDKVQEKSKKDITIMGQKLSVGETYLDELKKIKF